jgi:hypothetical protein
VKRAFLIAGMIACTIGAAIYLLAAFGPRQGDGFGNIGAAELGIGILFVGLIPLAIGLLMKKGTVGE